MDDLIIRVHQPQSDLFQALYGDPRGKFESLIDRKLYYREQFDKDSNLDMSGWQEVFSSTEIKELFVDVVEVYKNGKVDEALGVMFQMFNSPGTLAALANTVRYTGRSMSLGDVVEFAHGDKREFYYCDAGCAFTVITPINP